MDEATDILGLGSAEAREAFWRGLFDIHLDPLAFLDSRYQVVRANLAMAAALGCRAEDLIGRHCYEVFHDVSCPVSNCPHARLLSDGCAHAEEVFVQALGGIHWISVTPVFDTEGALVGSLHIARNVSRYKALESELRVARDAMAARAEARSQEVEQHVRFEKLLVSQALECGLAKSEADLRRLIQSGVAEIAATGKYTRCVFAQVSEKDLRVIAQYEPDDVPVPFGSSDAEGREIAMQVLSARNGIGFVSRLPDGSERCVSVCPATNEDRVVFVLFVEYRPDVRQNGLPMTPERLRLFCQVFGNALWRHVNMVEIQQMQDELTRLDRVSRLAQLTAMLAHELNQPLAAMLCNAQAAVRLLEQTPPDVDETRLALDDIVDNARRAGAVVQRTRALFKGARQAARPVSMHALVDSVCTLLHNEIVLADISVCQRVDAALPQVLGDEVQLQQVLRNLLANAIDAVRGKPKDERRITVTAEVDASARLFLLRVQDSGIGFTPGQEEELFKPFHTTKEDGMGMGLAICRQIVESFGGTIQAERVPSGGTLFRVALPLA